MLHTNERILATLEIGQLNEMQITAQESILKSDSVLLVSPTGSGKTLAFLLATLQLLEEQINGTQCLILLPTRELAIQIEQVWKRMRTGYKVNVCYGGHSIDVEIKNLAQAPTVLIGTPGRILDHIQKRSFDTNAIKILVLDEFDKSLEVGFHEEIAAIIASIPNIEKRILVSATKSVEIPAFTGVKALDILDFSVPHAVNEKLSLKLVRTDDKDKFDILLRLLCSLDSEPALIFFNHRDATERAAQLLNKAGILTAFYHGGMDQDDRERAISRFRNGSINYLVATDIAARGLDIASIQHVIHYHLPKFENEFIHRNGRTARMHALGNSFIILSKEEILPNFIEADLESFIPPLDGDLPNPPTYETIYISGGKKNKLNKTDIVGFFIQKGRLDKSDIQLIEVKDFMSFAAVKKNKVHAFLQAIKEQKMKGKKYKIEVLR
jgi:superfamily II DNA/RNA helicase